MNQEAILDAVIYFEDAVRESDEIMEECSEKLQAELTEQKVHFETALDAMRQVLAAPEFPGFAVIDRRTGKSPDLERIALEEPWASGLVHCDMEGFLLGEDGALYLADECGNQVPADRERFQVISMKTKPALPEPPGLYAKLVERLYAHCNTDRSDAITNEAADALENLLREREALHQIAEKQAFMNRQLADEVLKKDEASANYSQVTEALRRSGFSSLEELLAAFRQVKTERDELLSRNKRLSEDYSVYSGSALERADRLIEDQENEIRAIKAELEDYESRLQATLDQLSKVTAKRNEYFEHLRGLCFCCEHKNDGFDCHAKCYGHRRGSAWVYGGPQKEA